MIKNVKVFITFDIKTINISNIILQNFKSYYIIGKYLYKVVKLVKYFILKKSLIQMLKMFKNQKYK